MSVQLKGLENLFAGALSRYPANQYITSYNAKENQTYRQFAASVNSIQNRLISHGIKKGERIAICTPTCIEALWLFWAAMRLGIIVVPIDPSAGKHVLSYVLRHCSPRLLLTHNAVYKRMEFPEPLEPQVVLLDDHLKGSPAVEWKTWMVQTARVHGQRLHPMVEPHDAAVILYTSGSTGNPKGVVLSHGALRRSAEIMAKTYEWLPADLFFNLGELHTMSGLRNTCLVPFVTGSSVLLCPQSNRTTVFDIVACISAYKCSMLGCGPFLIRQMQLFSSRLNQQHLSSLRAILCTGSPLDAELATWAHNRFGIPVLNYYGLTETAGLCAGHTPSTFAKDPSGIGFEIGAKLLILDKRSRALPDGKIGELAVSSPSLMTGYFRQPNATRTVMKAGVFLTGDLALRQNDGRIMLAGRKRNMIKNAHTEMVFFEEVEVALERHPSVSESGVCGYVSELGDERLAAFIVPAKQIGDPVAYFSELKRYLKHELGPQKVPSVFNNITKLPRNSSGKILRKQLERFFT